MASTLNNGTSSVLQIASDINDNGQQLLTSRDLGCNIDRYFVKARRRLPKLVMPTIDLSSDTSSDEQELSPPAKLKRQDAFLGRVGKPLVSMIKEKKEKAQYRNYNAEALMAYKVWTKDVEANEVTIEDPAELDEFANLLSYQADAIGQTQDGNMWPILIKPIFQAVKADPKSIVEVVTGWGNCFIEKDDNNEWKVKKYSKLWFTANNTMALYNCRYMVVLLFNPKTQEILPIDIDINRAAYNLAFRKLNDYFMEIESDDCF